MTSSDPTNTADIVSLFQYAPILARDNSESTSQAVNSTAPQVPLNQQSNSDFATDRGEYETSLAE